MEITHGALNTNSNHSAFIYEQTSNRHLITEHDKEPFDVFKAKLRSALPYKEFATPEELGEQVYADLVTILDRDWPLKKELSAVESERLAHDAFALNRTQAYIANPDYYRRFEEFVGSDGTPIVLWGKSGLGKSALMAYLTSEYTTLHPEAFVMRHFVGATASASSAIDIMRHAMLEIKARYDLPDDLPSDDEKFSEEFPAWLAKVRSSDKFIVAIDAVNQLTGIGNELHWLPEFIPSNVRLIISTTPELPLEQLRKRNWAELEIRSLGPTERVRISEEFLERYHKHLSPQQLDVIERSLKLESPLFLRTVLEELRVFGVHRELDEHLANYLACEDENELFQIVLSRMESDYGAAIVRDVMSAIWASRYGLTETELLEITNLTRYALSEFLIALEFHLIQRSGLYSFFHNYLREAVEFRYLYNEDEKKQAHIKFAEYFSTREYSLRRRDEEPWQWQQADEKSKLEQCLMDPQMVAMFESDRDVYEAFSYWKSLPEISFDEVYIERLKGTEIGKEKKFSVYKNIISLFITAGKYLESGKFLDNLLPHFEQIGISKAQLLEIHEQRAAIDYHLGHYELAIKQVENLLEDKSNSSIATDLELKLLDLISSSYYYVGKFSSAIEFATEALRISRTSFGEQSYQTAMKYKNLGAFYMADGKLEMSEQACTQAWMLYSKLFGENHPESALCRMNLASCYTLQNELAKASFHYSQTEIGFISTIGQRHPLTLQCGNNIAYLEVQKGNILAAQEKCLKQLDLCRKSIGTEALNTAIIGILTGFTYYQTKEYLTAKKYYQLYLPVLTKIRGENHPDVIRYKARLEEIYKAVDALSGS